jgi:hypothetical protein
MIDSLIISYHIAMNINIAIFQNVLFRLKFIDNHKNYQNITSRAIIPKS